MSCYFRHLESILNEAGIVVTPANKKPIDQAIHEFVGVAYKDCPVTWKHVKQEILGDETKRQELVRKLKSAVG